MKHGCGKVNNCISGSYFHTLRFSELFHNPSTHTPKRLLLCDCIKGNSCSCYYAWLFMLKLMKPSVLGGKVIRVGLKSIKALLDMSRLSQKLMPGWFSVVLQSLFLHVAPNVPCKSTGRYLTVVGTVRVTNWGSYTGKNRVGMECTKTRNSSLDLALKDGN